MSIRAILITSFAVSLLGLTGHGAPAQGPNTIKLVVPVAPGGALDYVARLLAEQVQRANGKTIVVESRPGAGTAIGTEAVAHAVADGDTLLFTAGGNLLLSPHVRKVGYDPLTDLEPICALVRFPEIIAVNANSPFHTLADLLGAARAHPGQLTVASLGPASDLQFAFEKLKRAANVDLIYVPYPGVAPAVNALLGDHVTAAVTSYSSASAQLKAGKLRAVATTTGTRLNELPNVPTVAESGFPGYAEEIWFGVFAPSRTPHQTISQLGEWFSGAVHTPEVGQKLAVQGLYPKAICGPDFAAQVRRDYDEFGRIVREAKIGTE